MPPTTPPEPSDRRVDRDLAHARAEHQAHAEYRLRLLELVDAYRVARGALTPTLERALEQVLPPSAATSARDDDFRIRRLREEIANLAQREMALTGKLRVLVAEAREIAASAIPSNMSQTHGHAEVVVAVLASLLLPLEDAGEQFSVGRDRIRETLAAIDPSATWITPGIDRAFGIADKLLTPTSAVFDLITEARQLKEFLRRARTDLHRLEGWRESAGSQDLEGTLVAHPAVRDFEDTWRVLVTFNVRSNDVDGDFRSAAARRGASLGRIEIGNVFDDHYPILYQQLSPDLAKRLLLRHERRPDQYLVIDTRAALNRFKATVGAVVDDDSTLKKYPFTLPLVPEEPEIGTAEHETWKADHQTWQATIDGLFDEDRDIVVARMNSPFRDWDALAEKREPALAEKRRDGHGGQTLGSGGRTVTDLWHDTLQRLQKRWSVIEPIVSATAPPGTE